MRSKIQNSIDIETLDTRCTAEILSIGCSQFDIVTGDIIAEFYLPVSCDGFPDLTFSKDDDTVKWWQWQTEEAKAAVFNRVYSVQIQHALEQLSTFLRVGFKTKDVIVWGNGSSFDITILERAFDVCGVDLPWKFYNVRDMRTIVSLAEYLKGFDKKSIKRIGTPHNALDDASHQARVISSAFNHLGDNV